MKFLIRLDDVTEGTDWKHFDKLEKTFDRLNIKPILGVVPLNKDDDIINESKKIPRDLFFEKVRKLQSKGYIIAMHGVEHLLEKTKESSVVNINDYGELVNLQSQERYDKLKMGKDILASENIYTDLYMPPAHWIDIDTINILKKLDFKYITDGLFIYPKLINDITFIPQQIWRARKIRLPGIFTICLHINNNSEKEIQEVIDFLEMNHSSSLDYGQIKFQKYNSAYYQVCNYFTKILFSFYLYVKKR